MEQNKTQFKGIINVSLRYNVQIIDNTTQSNYDNICHYHTFYELTMIYDGCCFFDVNNCTQLHTEGTLHLVRPQDHHTMVCVEPLRYFILQFNESFLDPTLVHLLEEKKEPLILHLDESRFKVYLDELRTMKALSQTFGDESCLQENLLELRFRLQLFLLHILREKNGYLENQPASRENHILLRIMEYTRQHYRENISLADVANYAGISKNYLSTYFHDKMKITYWKYLSHFRLNMAMSMIISTSELISQIAYTCGFNSYTNFSKAFRERYGLSPSLYRKKNME